MHKIPKLGAHVSTAGGLFKLVENAQAIGAEAVQIFGASPRQWVAKVPGKEDVAKYNKAIEGSGVGPVFLHGAYLVNLAAATEESLNKSIVNLGLHMQIAEAIGAEGVIFHVGSGQEMPKELAMKKAIVAMKTVLKNVPGKTKLIMENSASAKKIGATPEELGVMMAGVNSPRVKICVDTAHSFEAGLIESYTSPNITKFLDAWDNAVGLENLVAFHVNDSKTPYLSNHDRHENLGEGFIGLDGFKNFAKEKRTWDKAWLLEVPGFDNMGPDKKNVDILKSLF
ncbi:MAG: deoxyribonuclease IV [bacterium]|nr:deoxyribonuclease IV [bacterium]